MKIKVRTLYSDYVGIPNGVMEALGWTNGEEVDIDIPMTGAHITISREKDPVKFMGGVREVIHG